MTKDEIFDSFEQELVWLISKHGGVNKLAAKLQISPPAISHWLRRRRLPSPQQALNLEAFTNGAIRREVIRPDLYPTTVLLGEQCDISSFSKKEFEQDGREG